MCSGCLKLGKLLSLPESQFLHVEDGDSNSQRAVVRIAIAHVIALIWCLTAPCAPSHKLS